MLTACAGFLYAIDIIYRAVRHDIPFTGWAPIMILILVIGGLLMLMLGIIGEVRLAHLRRGPWQAQLRRTERVLNVGPRRADAVIAVVIFSLSAIGASAYYSRYVSTGGRPFFYQTYFEPAVMVACGKGFLVAHPQPPAVRDFLAQKTDRFSCDELPPDLRLGTDGLYQRPWRYLMTTVAIAWRVVGISWSRLAPLFGILFAATTALVYALSRLLVSRIAAIACAAAMSISTLQLTNLPNLRDYAKAPFTLALVMILIALAVRPWRRREVLLLSLGYGLVMGVGYGFRTDLLVDIPPFLSHHRIVPARRRVAQPAGEGRGCRPVCRRLHCRGLADHQHRGFRGGCQWHVFLLGLTSPFNDALGVRGGSYGLGALVQGRVFVGDGVRLRQPIPARPRLHRVLLARI